MFEFPGHRVRRRIALAILLVAVASMAPMQGGNPREADTEEIAIRALIARAQWSEAEVGARARLARLERSAGADSVPSAGAVDLLVAILLGSGRWGEPEVKVLAGRAVAVKEALLGPDAPEVSDSLLNLGVLQRRAGPVSEARKTLERALRIREQALGPASLPVAEALGEVGWALSDTGDLPGAIRLEERALRIREDLLGPDDLLVAESLSNLGGAVRNAGDFPRAIEVHQRALRIRRRSLPEGHPETALSLFSVADAMHQDGDLPGALPFYDEALRLRRAAPIMDKMRTSQVLIGLADLRRDLGDFEAARPLYEEGHRLRMEVIGVENYLVGVSYHSYAQFLMAAGDDAGARVQFESAIGIFDRTLPPGHPLQALGRQGLGSLLAGQGALEPARQVLQQAADIWKGVPVPNHPFAADTDLALGAVLRDLGRTAEARTALDRALANLAVSLGTDHPRYGEALLERARLSWSEGQAAAALDGALLAESTLRRSLRAAIRGLSEGEALRYQDIMISGLDMACSVASSAPGTIAPAKRTALFEAMIRSRSLVLDEIAARHRRIARDATQQIVGLNDALEAARHRYARLLLTGPSPQSPAAHTALLAAARTDMERSERALAEASRDFVDLQRRQNPTHPMISGSLPSGTALISILAYRQSVRTAVGSRGIPSYMALVLAPGAIAPEIVPLGPAAPLETRIDRWLRDASRPPADRSAERESLDAAADLRRALWDPVAKRIAGAPRVLVVPDGAIHAVALATLVDERGRYLLESGPTFHYLSAERDVLASPLDAPAGHGLLALGGPDFDAEAPEANAQGTASTEGEGPVRLRSTRTLPCAGTDSLKFDPLPGAAAEAEEVGSLWSAASRGGGAAETSLLLKGRDASEANLSRAAPGKRVLHLATHAFFIPTRCDGTTEGGPGEAPDAKTAPGRLQAGTPLRVAGLALAGANRRSAGVEGPDDGLLTGEEISSLDLDGVEWIVLSGCRTGIGLARAGEGIFGLRRSFQIAGARTLVMSLWPVSDNDTQAWMAELYRGRAAGAATADAVRAASRRIVEQRRKAGVTEHPFFWGAFVAAGDWR